MYKILREVKRTGKGTKASWGERSTGEWWGLGERARPSSPIPGINKQKGLKRKKERAE